MAYSETLANRVRKLVSDRREIVEKKMFGGICVLIHGNMACGILNEDLIVRVGPENYRACLDMEHTRVFDTTGRVMKGWVMVGTEGYVSDAALSMWVEKGISFALTLPPK